MFFFNVVLKIILECSLILTSEYIRSSRGVYVDVHLQLTEKGGLLKYWYITRGYCRGSIEVQQLIHDWALPGTTKQRRYNWWLGWQGVRLT